MNFKIVAKYIVGIVATIFLGALGSGLWEKLLSPGVDWLYRLIVDVISTVSLDYKNSIYESAASGFNEHYSYRVFVFFLSFSSISFLFFVERNNIFFRIMAKSISSTNFGKFQIICKVIALSIVLYTTYNITNHKVVQNTKTYSLVSLDILRPYIGELNFHKLKSDYLQIKTARNFYNFNKLIVHEAEVYKIRLPIYQPI